MKKHISLLFISQDIYTYVSNTNDNEILKIITIGSRIPHYSILFYDLLTQIFFYFTNAIDGVKSVRK